MKGVKPLRIGLLGASKIAPMAVIQPAAKRKDVIITAVAARSRERAVRYAAEHGVAAVAEDYAALMAREDVDLIYNGLPIAAHHEWTLKALSAGKAVLCEKALADNAEQAIAMTTAAERAGLPLIEAFHYRHHSVMVRAIALLRSGALGRLTGANASFCVPIAYEPDEIRWRADQGGGALGDLGAYPAHALRNLLGDEPQVISARAQMAHGVDAATEARLLFKGGVEASLSCSMIADRPTAEILIQGDQGQLRIMNFVAPQLGCRFTVEIGGALRDEPVEGPSTYEAQLDHVVEVMAGRTTPLTGGRDAIANMALLDAIRAAAG
jgi:predicted dehydrogenase